MSICLIHTGGTIGMARTSRGFAPKAGIVEDAVAKLRANGEQREEVEILRLDPLIDSANAGFTDWNRIAAAIEERHERVEAFVITHGTDTMSYTAAALCFALEGLNKPVILTGAMSPIGQQGSDGLRNLSDALDSSLVSGPGVWVQFGGKKLHGARLRKSHSSAFDAFESPIEPRAPLIRAPWLTRTAYGAPEIAALSMAPGVSPKVIASVLEQCEGVVLRAYGSGTVPESKTLRRALIEARDRGVPVIAVSQCAEGGIALGTYAAGAMLVDADVVDGRDMTVEAAYAKLAHAMSYGQDFASRRARLAQPLCGEATFPA